ncbi:type IX secretion system protein PorD [Lutibacter sp.]
MKLGTEFMRNILQIILILLTVTQLKAQELNCSITVNSDKIPGSNRQIYTTLQRSLGELVNQKRWTNFNYKLQERIDCNLTLTILEQTGDNFKGNIQIQSSRPVYNSSYLTPVFNFKDNNFSFQYAEFEPLVFNENIYESNLVSIISFYVYTILGFDADTFSSNGGTTYFTKAQDVLVQAQQSGYAGWNQNDGTGTRFTLIDNILSPTYSLFRDSMYKYHLKGLDVMGSNKKKAKQIIADSIENLKTIFDRRPNAFLLRVFMDSKATEIVSIFSDGPRFETFKLKEDLLKISPLNATKWNEIK